MAISSRINSSLKKKRRMGKFKKVIYIAIFVLFFLSLFILFLTWNKIVINDVSISGNTTVSKDDLLSIVDSKLDQRYLWIIRTDNLFLIRSTEISSQILEKFPKIESVKIGFKGINSIEVRVVERSPADVWCLGNITNLGQCYFMDKNGFVYGLAPKFSGTPFFEFFGILNKDSAVGMSYFNQGKFAEYLDFIGKLNDMGFSPIYFNAVDVNQYEVGLAGGGIIRIDDSQPLSKSITNLQALIDSSYIKTDKGFLQKINYIDLRFGNKVAYDLKK